MTYLSTLMVTARAEDDSLKVIDRSGSLVLGFDAVGGNPSTDEQWKYRIGLFVPPGAYVREWLSLSYEEGSGVAYFHFIDREAGA